MKNVSSKIIASAIHSVCANEKEVRPLLIKGIEDFLSRIDSSMLPDILYGVDAITIPMPNEEQYKFEEAEFNVKDLTIDKGKLFLSLRNEDYEEIEINSNLVGVLNLYNIFLALEEYHDEQEEQKAEDEERKAYRY